MFANAIAGTAALLALSGLCPFAAAAPHKRSNDSSPSFSLTTQLRLADSAAERYQLLPDDEDFVHTFSEDDPTTILADAKSFPALVGTGASMALGSLPACGMSFVHLHPRSAEIFAVTSGTIETEMVPEIGAVDANGEQRVVRATLGANQMTVFPQGSFHTQINPDCEPAGALAAFTSEDIGFQAVAGQLFGFDDEILETSFGGGIAGEDIDAVRGKIPASMALKVDSCLEKCGIEKRRV